MNGRLTTILALFFLAACTQPAIPAPTASPTLPVFTTYRLDNAFQLLYPQSWQTLTVGEGLLLLAASSTLNGDDNGPQLTILRQAPEALRTDLAGTLDHYLTNGPIAGGFAPIDELQPFPVAGRDGLAVTLVSEASADRPAIKGHLVAAQAESGAVYILSATALEAEWAHHWPTFEIAINSFALNE